MTDRTGKRRVNNPSKTEQSGGIPDMFDVAAIADLPDMTNEELKELEVKVQKEFKSITRDYLKARLVRINSMIDSLDKHINFFRDNFDNWNDDYEAVVRQIHDIRYAQEEICLGRNDPNYSTNDISEMFANYTSPFDFDTYLNHQELHTLPFDESFQNLILKFNKELLGLLNEQKRHIKLLQDRVDDNKKIIWLRYRANLLDKKNQLLNDHLQELSMLNDLEQKIIRNEPIVDTNGLIRDWDTYHNSLIPPNTKLTKDNTRDYISNKKILNNKIELTNIKHNNLFGLKRFRESQYVPQMNPNKRTRLLDCSGLSKDEVDHDLSLIKKTPEQNSTQELLNDPNDNNDEVVEVDDPLTPKSDNLQQDYSKLLQVMSKHDFQLPEIPAIENFPQLG